MILTPFVAPLIASCAASVAPPSGTVVEARTASVFAGACHYNGERTTAGREAVVAWSIERGLHAQVDVSGARAVLVVVDEVNLADAPRARRAILHLDRDESPERRAALTSWVAARVPSLAGDWIVSTDDALGVNVVDESYDVRVAGRVELVGSAMPDRACCKMPFSVWYEPFQPLAGRLVGRNDEFRVDADELGFVSSRPGENAAFLGWFGPGAGAPDRAHLALTVARGNR